ncbi:MAG TPA: ABC transporter substrate-binding protein [Ktedonobacteraceae bacterium]|nr:ABC transporter substrate-binding protein [Ktedonobacteraceae bacterium]
MRRILAKRIFVPFIIFLMLAVAACGSSTGGGGNSGGGGNAQQGLTGGNSYNACPSSTNTTAASPESGSVTLTVSGFSSSPAEDALVQQNLNKFTQAHPNIKINWSPIPGDYPTKMRANVASGTVPDVFYLTPDMSSEYIQAGKVLNLSPYMQRDNVSPNDYYASLLSPFTCKSGQAFGIPKDWNTLGVFYNKTLFQAAGLSAPSPNWTWSDMQNDAQKVTKNPGTTNSVYGITLDSSTSRWAAFLFADGGTVLNKDGTQAAFDNQAGIDSLKFYASFQKNNTGTRPQNVGSTWAGDAFGKERAAMALEGGWLIPYMTQTYPNVQYGIAPVPVAPNGKRADLIYTNAWAAYGNTKHPDAAWQLIKYMTGSDVQTSQLHAGFALPTLKSLANDSYFTQNPGVKVMFDAATYGYADYYGSQDQAIHTDLDNAIEKVLLNQADVPTALQEATSKVNNQLQQQ